MIAALDKAIDHNHEEGSALLQQCEDRRMQLQLQSDTSPSRDSDAAPPNEGHSHAHEQGKPSGRHQSDQQHAEPSNSQIEALKLKYAVNSQPVERGEGSSSADLLIQRCMDCGLNVTMVDVQHALQSNNGHGGLAMKALRRLKSARTSKTHQVGRNAACSTQFHADLQSDELSPALKDAWSEAEAARTLAQEASERYNAHILPVGLPRGIWTGPASDDVELAPRISKQRLRQLRSSYVDVDSRRLARERPLPVCHTSVAHLRTKLLGLNPQCL